MEENQQLKEVGLKITAPRVKVLQILAKSHERHVSAEDIYKMFLEQHDDVGLATVYRVLTQFEEAGLVIRHNFEGGSSVFELNAGEHHDHLICTECNGVEEFLDETIEARQLLIAKKVKFKITSHVLTIYGVCHTCQ